MRVKYHRIPNIICFIITSIAVSVMSLGCVSERDSADVTSDFHISATEICIQRWLRLDLESREELIEEVFISELNEGVLSLALHLSDQAGTGFEASDPSVACVVDSAEIEYLGVFGMEALVDIVPKERDPNLYPACFTRYEYRRKDGALHLMAVRKIMSTGDIIESGQCPE